jgi:hypothetical protein
MMGCTLNRFQIVLLGCSLAAVSSLITPSSRATFPPHRVLALPEMLGSWELLEEGQLEESELRILQANDHWRRIYQCRKTKQVVVVTLVVGASGPLTCHQPEVCYARNEFCSHSDASLWTVPDRRDRFRFQTLEPRQVERPALTISYAWHDGDLWRAPTVPRIQLAGCAALQRLQISIRHPTGMAQDARAALQQFVQLAVDATAENQTRVAALPTSAITSP